MEVAQEEMELGWGVMIGFTCQCGQATGPRMPSDANPVLL